MSEEDEASICCDSGEPHRHAEPRVLNRVCCADERIAELEGTLQRYLECVHLLHSSDTLQDLVAHGGCQDEGCKTTSALLVPPEATP